MFSQMYLNEKKTKFPFFKIFRWNNISPKNTNT
jgi:hypothetical protein